MWRFATALCAVVLIFAIGTPVTAQNSRSKETTGETLTPHQQSALWTIEQLFDTAKGFEDVRLKVKVQAQIADALWRYEETKARQRFESAFRELDSMAPSKRKIVNTFQLLENPQFTLRSEVLGLLARHDPEFAEKLANSIENSTLSPDQDFTMPGPQSERGTLYLRLALNLSEVDPERAAQMASISLNGGVNFLLTPVLLNIRRTRPALADSIFRNALSIALRDQTYLAASIRFLAPYAFPNYEGEGMAEEIVRITGTSVVDEPLQRQFLTFVYESLLRKVPDREHGAGVASVSNAEALFDYVTIRKLLPFFGRLMPDRIDVVRGKLNDLANRIPIERRAGISNLETTISTQDLLTKAETLGPSKQRDVIYVQAAMSALRDGDPHKALSITEKISNEQDREGVSAVIRFQGALRAVRDGDVDLARDFARGLENLPQRAIIYSQISQIFANKKDTQSATEVLAEVQQRLSKADNGPDKAIAMLTLAEALSRLDALKGFDAMRYAIEALNHVEFNSEGEKPAGGAIVKRTPLTLEGLDFQKSFSHLARMDFYRALQLTQSLKKKELTVLAQLAVCRELLNSSLASSDKSAGRTSQKSSNKKRN